MADDWFTQNAPQATQATQNAAPNPAGDWFSANAPKRVPDPNAWRKNFTPEELQHLDNPTFLDRVKRIIPFTVESQMETAKEQAQHPGGLPGSFEGHPENVGEYVPATVGRAAEGAVDISRGNISQGLHKGFQAATNALAPMAPVIAPAAPLATIRGAAGGAYLGKAYKTVTGLLGATPDQQQVAEDFGNVLGGLAGQQLNGEMLNTAIKRSGAAVTKLGAQLQGIDPDWLQLISSKLAAAQRIAAKDPLGVLPPRAQAAANLIQKAAADKPMATTDIPASPYRLSGNQIQDAVTVTPRQIIPPSRQLVAPAAAGQVPTPVEAAPYLQQPTQPQYKAPNATYLREDIRSQTQQPKLPKSKTPLLDSLREWNFTRQVNDEMNAQTGSPVEEQVMQWISDHNQTLPGGKKLSNLADVEDALTKEAAQAAGVKLPPDMAKPQFAYRVRDAGETGIMPKGHAQATLDRAQAESYIPGREQAQNAPQELVRVDLNQLDPKEYTLMTGPGGKRWVRFKNPVPESYVEKVNNGSATTDQDLTDLLQQSIARARASRGAKQ